MTKEQEVVLRTPGRNQQPGHALNARIRPSRAATIMQTLARLAAKAAVIAAAAAGLYVASNYSDYRGASNWTTSAVSEPKEPLRTEPARSSSSSQQRLRAEPGSCESQTWPNILPECITGPAEPAKVAERPVHVSEQPSSILLRPTKLREAVPDPEVTGSLPASERVTVRERERPVLAKKKNRREREVTAKATKPKAEQRARAERQLLREAGRRHRPAVADRAAPEPAERVSEPIQFRLAEGNR